MRYPISWNLNISDFHTLNLMNIAITGSVGSGKSGVAGILAGYLQVDSIDTDGICRELLQHSQSGWSEVRRRWPQFFIDDVLDRKLLREAVFEDRSVREELEDILHPLVRKKVLEAMQIAHKNNVSLLVEVPLLFEVGWKADFDHVVAVYATGDTSVERTVLRDGVPRKQAESILALQMSPEEKAEHADSVINNSGIWAATVLQVAHLGRHLQEVGLD